MGYHLTSPGCEAGCTSRTAYPRFARCEAGLRFFTMGTGRWLSRDLIWENGGENLTCALLNDAVNLLDPWGLKVCYRWMLITFYTGQKPKDGRNSWNKADLTEMDAATGLGGYEYDAAKREAVKTGPSRGRDDYAYPPETTFRIHRGRKGIDRRIVRDGGAGWVFPRPGNPEGVGRDEWIDLWTPTSRQGIEVKLVETDVGDKCDCPSGWSTDKDVVMPANLKKIADALE